MPTLHKRIRNPIPPEYANVFVLKIITIIVGVICLLLTGYATWTVFTMSNRIASYHTSLEAAVIADRVAPIDFRMLDSVSSTEHNKQTLSLPRLTHDLFYNTSITTTDTGFNSTLSEVTTTPVTSLIVTTTQNPGSSSTLPL